MATSIHSSAVWLTSDRPGPHLIAGTLPRCAQSDKVGEANVDASGCARRAQVRMRASGGVATGRKRSDRTATSAVTVARTMATSSSGV